VTGLYVYPRLPRGQALRLLHELVGHDPASARELAATSHPAAAPTATGPPPVPEAAIEHSATKVRELAASLGFPTPLTRPNVAKFDQPCGDVLVEEMQIVPADAANEDVWSFLTLVVLPDIALWRFPDMKDERFLGRPRNTFRRVWWRSYTLSGANSPDDSASDPLGEDELVNIFERPSIARTAELARCMTRAVRELPVTPGVPRSEVMRELAKRVRRLLAFVCVDVLESVDVDALVRSELVASVAAIRDVA
jgi:Family of unknown function (DUF6339)